MINKKEIATILAITIIIAFSVSLLKSFELFIYGFLSIFLIIIINTSAKKIASYYLDSKIEIKFWEIKQYWVRPHDYFKKAFPAGVFFPILTTAISLGNLVWMGSLVFDVKSKTHRAAKRHGLYSFSEMTERHIGLIAAAGIFANIIFAILAYLLNLPTQIGFVKLSILYIFFNLLPLSDLDGNKIYFGNMVLWAFLASISLIGILALILIA